MNIRDVMVQEQEKTGREAGQTVNIYAGKKAQEHAAAKALADITTVKGNMEVPVTPVNNGNGENSGNYSFPETAAAAADSLAANEQAGQNLAILTGEDYSKLEQEEGALEKYQESSLDRAVERIRSEREWKEERLEEGARLREELQEGLENIQAQGFLSEKGEAQIREALERADLPVTQDMVNQVVSALQMSQSVSETADAARNYLLTQNLPPTIENLYHAQYSGMEGKDSSSVPEEVWEKYEPQIEQILQEMGGGEQQPSPQQLLQAKWLFANELPIDADTLENLQALEDLSKNISLDHTLHQIIAYMAAGGRAVDTDLVQGDRMYQEYQDAASLVERVAGIDEQDIYKALQEVEEDAGGALLEKPEDTAGALPGNAAENQEGQTPGRQNPGRQTPGWQTDQPSELNLAALLEAAEGEENTIRAVENPQIDIQAVTVRRQLEEIRLMMTVSSVADLHRQGFAIEIEPLESVIEQLREIEDTYYIRQAGDKGLEITQEHLADMHEVMRQTAEIAAAPAALLGSSMKQHQLITLHELHGMAVSMTRQYQQYQEDYEAVSTKVRQDLGDTLQKTFEGIPKMLQNLGLEDTGANERAVRILAYNQMEITEDNIQAVKQWDAEVNLLLRQSKPSMVLEMIRQGRDPLNMPIQELNEYLHEMDQENGVSEEEKYSRFLWQLERQNGINELERRDYIALYQLLHQIEQSDGAVIGAVLQAGQTMDLKHLQTAVKTMRARGLDERVSEGTGVREIPVRYFQSLAEETKDVMTPAKMLEISDGDVSHIMDKSLEQVAEELKEAEGDPQLLQEYYDRQAEEVRETVRLAEQARAFLEQYELPDTIENLRAAEFMLQEGGSPVKELLERRRVLDERRQQELEEVLEELPESIDSREELEERCRQSESFMQQILSKSKETADINSEDLKYLTLLGQGLRLQQSLTRHQNYEIPILTGDTVTTIHLTILQGKEQTGRVQIGMENADFGRVSGEVQIQQEQVKGLILCDDRVGFDALKERGTTLMEKLEHSGFSVKNFSYGMDYKKRGEMYDETVKGDDADTADLYRIAKIIVHHITETVQQTIA